MPSSGCCVPLCTNRGGHSFPKDPARRKAWVIAIKRDRWQPTISSVVCRSHFQADDYISENAYGNTPACKRLKLSAIPSVFNWSLPDNEAAANRRKEHKQGVKKKPVEIIDDLIIFNDCDINVEEVCPIDITFVPECTIIDHQTSDVHTQTEKDSTGMFSAEKFERDSEGIHFYTGLETYEKFIFVFRTLGPVVDHLNYAYSGRILKISSLNQFFLTLIKLRLHKSNFELSRLFEISEFIVADIFVTWICLMEKQWKEIDLWPTAEIVNFYSPTDFKTKYPSTRIIIDGTEIPVKKPAPPLAQQSTFSTYKNRNTVKVLIGVTPGG